MKSRKTGRPIVYHLTKGDAAKTVQTPFGAVGKLFCGDGIEAVWVSKHNEPIDPNWFSQKKVDLITVLQGKLRVDYERDIFSQVLEPGDMLVLPPRTRCRAYRWPRTARKATIFLAVYPI
jgi:hypothetical protein